MDPTSVGNLGTLVFLSTRQPEKVVTAYPVDEPVVTIGRDAECDIRLYYPEVSPVHCKLIFEDRKVNALPLCIFTCVVIIVNDRLSWLYSVHTVPLLMTVPSFLLRKAQIDLPQSHLQTTLSSRSTQNDSDSHTHPNMLELLPLQHFPHLHVLVS